MGQNLIAGKPGGSRDEITALLSGGTVPWSTPGGDRIPKLIVVAENLKPSDAHSSNSNQIRDPPADPTFLIVCRFRPGYNRRISRLAASPAFAAHQMLLSATALSHGRWTSCFKNPRTILL